MNTAQTVELYTTGLASGAAGELGAFTPTELHLARLSRASAIITSLPDVTDVLDIGCGKALLYGYLPKSVRYTGIDPVPELVRYAHENGLGDAVSLCSVEDAPTSMKAQMVVSLGVLSHIDASDLMTFLAACALLAHTYILIEGQDPDVYAGKFCSHSAQEVSKCLHALGFVDLRYDPPAYGDSSYRLLGIR